MSEEEKKHKKGCRFSLRSCLLLAILIPTLAGLIIYGLHKRSEARTRRLNDTVKADLAQLKSAIQSFKVVNQRYPASLDELIKPVSYVDEIPIDPYSTAQEPYRYMNLYEGNIVLVYSVGKDGEDNHCYEDIPVIVHSTQPFGGAYLSQCLQIERTKNDPDNGEPYFMRADILSKTDMPGSHNLPFVYEYGWKMLSELNKFYNDNPNNTPFPGIKQLPPQEIQWIKQVNMDELLAIIQQNEKAIDLTLQGSEKPYTKAILMEEDFHRSIFAVPNIPNRHIFAKIVAAKANYLESKGDLEGALHTYYAGIRMAQTMGYVSPYLEKMIAIAGEGICMSALCDSLIQYEYSPEQIKWIMKKMIELEQSSPSLAEACEITANRYQYLGDNMTMSDYHQWAKDNLSSWIAYKGNVNYREMVKYYFSYMYNAPKSIRENTTRFHLFTQLAERPYKESISVAVNISPKEPTEYNGYFIVDCISGLTRETTRQTRNSFVQIIAVLQLYKLRHGEYPENLDALTEILNPIPLDPFTDEMFIYEKSGGTFTLYTPGPELEDNMGLIEYDPTNGTLSPGDITFAPH